MKNSTLPSSRGFTLTEVIIAIGVLTVLLTGFISVFAPASLGIRKSISAAQIERLTGALEKELTTLRPGQTPGVSVGFNKAFDWILEGTNAANAILVYQYRGNPNSMRPDGSPEPVLSGTPGEDYVLQTMVRRVGETNLAEDFTALEGSVFYVKIVQLVDDGNGRMIEGDPGAIQNADASPAGNVDAYTEALISIKTEFYQLPQKSMAYLSSGAFTTTFNSADKKPVLTRNLAVLR